MSLPNFVTQEELDDLPEEPSIAFMTLFSHAQRRLAEKSAELDGDNEQQWRELNELRHSFMNVVVAAGRTLEVEPFLSLNVPQHDKFGERDHRQFAADVDHYVTQLMLTNSLNRRRESIAVSPTTKDRVRSYVHGLRQCVENGTMNDAKREALLNKLDAFEAELEKRRLSLFEVTKLLIAVASVPGALWATAEIPAKLSTNILQAVGEAKATEDENRQLPPVAPPKALLPPRTGEIVTRGTAFDSDLDDNVPF